MPEVLGIKETKEALIGTLALGMFVRERLKDGAQLNDALALGEKLLLDVQFKKLIEEAVKDADKVPAEIKDISLTEGAELLSALLEQFNKAA